MKANIAESRFDSGIDPPWWIPATVRTGNRFFRGSSSVSNHDLRTPSALAFGSPHLSRCFRLVPSMEGRQVARVPGLAESGSLEIPVGADLAHHGPQVVPEVDDGRPPQNQ